MRIILGILTVIVLVGVKFYIDVDRDMKLVEERRRNDMRMKIKNDSELPLRAVQYALENPSNVIQSVVDEVTPLLPKMDTNIVIMMGDYVREYLERSVKIPISELYDGDWIRLDDAIRTELVKRGKR